MRHIKRNDVVVAISGRNAGKGKPGKVLAVMDERGLALVEGFSIVKKALRKTQENPQGGIGEKEAPVALSNLMLFCPECKKGRKTGRAVEGGRKVRKCKKCGHIFE